MTSLEVIFFGISASFLVGLIIKFVKKQKDSRLSNQELNEIVYSIVKKLNSTDPTIDELTQIMLDGGKDLTGSEIGYVALINRPNGNVINTACTDKIPVNKNSQNQSNFISLKPDRNGNYSGLRGHSLNTRRPFFTNDPKHHSSYTSIPTGHTPIYRFLSVPVWFEGEIAGQVSLANKRTDYTESDLQSIIYLSELFSLCLSNERKLHDLKSKDDLYRSLFENIQEGVTILEPDESSDRFNLLDFNPVALDLGLVLKDTQKTVPGFTLAPEMTTKEVVSVYKKVSKSGVPFVTPFKKLKINKKNIWCKFNCFKLPSGKIVSIWNEETEKKNMQIDRENLFYKSPDMLAVCKFEGSFKQINPAWKNIMGWSTDELIGKSLLDFVHPDDIEKTLQSNNTLSAGKPLIKFKHRFKTKDGSYRWLSWSAYPKLDEKIVFAVVRDISDVVNSKKFIEETQAQLSAIFNGTNSVAFYITDALGQDPTILDFSPGAEKLFGYNKDEVLGTHVSKLHKDANFKHFFSKPDNLNGTQKGVQIETLLLRKTGETFPALFSTYPLLDSSMNMYATLGIAIDLSEVKFLEKQVAQTQKLEAIGTLAGGIAHDFNNILSVILGFSEIALETAEENSQLSNDIKEIVTAGKRAKDLVSQILTFSRQENEVKKPFKPYLLVKEVLKMLKASLPSTINIKSAVDTRSNILGDPSQFHQILMNLATNASHAMKESQGTLEFKLYKKNLQNNDNQKFSNLRPGEYVVLSVKDTGQGISDRNLTKIFDPFFTTKDKNEGTGLGLSVVHGIVESMEGKITVESKLNKGTKFMIYFPVLDQPFIGPKKKKNNLPKGNERILFVDDENSIVRLWGRSLQALGYSVTAVQNSQNAIDMFRRKHREFDLVISDLTMPGISGAELTELVRDISPEIPIIICTGSGKPISQLRVGNDQNFIVLQKPVDLKEMAIKIRECLGKKKLP